MHLGLRILARLKFHEAAQANHPPSGTFYDPAKTGKPLPSLGVHEHWNDPVNKLYSRNLDPVNGTGIELVQLTATNADPVAVVTNYHGWSNAVLVNNGLVGAVIVPDAGRVLQFRFLGSADGPFWENSNLDGQTATPSSWNTEGGFGGDKAWPSPQSDWGWPPPSGFDGSPNQCSIYKGAVTLTSPVDSTYQIRTTRVIELVFGQPIMRIRTLFQRVAATSRTNSPLGNWVVTQVKDPVGIYVPVPANSIFPQGYYEFDSLPLQFRQTNGFISFLRDSTAGASHKLGFDANTLIWVGTNLSMRIDAPRVAGLPATGYPDSGSSTEAYTKPGPERPLCRARMPRAAVPPPRGRPDGVRDHLHLVQPHGGQSRRRSRQGVEATIGGRSGFPRRGPQ